MTPLHAVADVLLVFWGWYRWFVEGLVTELRKTHPEAADHSFF